MASCGLVRWPTHGQGASRELISSCRSAGVVSKQHHGPHHCCGRRRSNAEFESLCSRFVEHASTCTTQPLRSMVSATSMRKRRRGALREAPGSDSVRVPRAAHSSPVKLSIAYGLAYVSKGGWCSRWPRRRLRRAGHLLAAGSGAMADPEQPVLPGSSSGAGASRRPAIACPRPPKRQHMATLAVAHRSNSR